jgi:sugar phosphate permease
VATLLRQPEIPAQASPIPGPIVVRWDFVAMMTAAIAISYFDRQTLPVAISSIERTIPLSDQQFSWLQSAFLIRYAVMYIACGRLLDVMGTRRGFLLIMACWSVACALHGLATGFAFLIVGTFHLIEFFAILLFEGTIRPLGSQELLSRVSPS